jgi:class 3 adenylate cyclase
LAHSHGSGIVHRDLKPGNVWLDAHGNAALGDFGLAAVLDRSRMTMAGMMVGTVAYMAPEQTLGRPPDARSDLYALGAMLYEMVCGRPPFLGDDAVGVISQHINTSPVAPTWHNPDVPMALEALILQLLAKQPDERPASALDVAHELRRISAQSTQEPVLPPVAEVVTDLRRLDWGRFVGRQEEMGLLKGALESALSGRSAVAFVSGEPGIGKTRLAEEFGVYAGLRGAQVLMGRCYEGEQTVPYRPIVDALRQYARTQPDSDLRQQLGQGAPEIATMVSEVRQRFPDISEAPRLEAEADRLRLFDSITTFLHNASQSQPLVLFLDDLHWADKPSLLLLQHIGRHGTSDRLLVLATYRDIELDRTHPLSESLAALRRLPNFSRIALHGLQEECVEELLSSIDPSDESTGARHTLAHALYGETEGNPFFIREVLSHLVEEGKLEREGGRWVGRVGSVSELGIPEGVREVIGRRLTHLSEPCNRMLTRASTMTRGFTWAALSAICLTAQTGSTETSSSIDALTEPELLDLLDEALAAQLIAERKSETPTVYDFTHALIRQTLYEELSGPRRVLLHRQVGEALERLWTHQLDQHVGELAYHFFQAAPGGDVEKAIDYATRAGDRATALHGWEDAAAHYERVLLTLDLHSQPDDVRRARSLLSVGEAYMAAGDPARGRTALDQAVDLADRIDDVDLLARAALAFGSDLVATEIGRTDRAAVSALERALARLPSDDSVVLARVMARLSLELGFSTERERAEGMGRHAIEMAKRLDSPLALASAMIAAQWVAARPNSAEELLTLADHVIALADAGRDPSLLYAASRARLVLLLQSGDIDAYREQLERLSRIADEMRHPFYSWAAAASRAMLVALDGDLELGERLSTEALVAGQQANVANAMMTFGAQMLAIRRLQGRLTELAPAVAQFSELYPSLDLWELVNAWIRVEEGDLQAGKSCLEAFEKRGFDSLPHDQVWLGRVSLLVRLCPRAGTPAQAEKIYTLLEPYASCHVSVESIVTFGSVSTYLGMLAALMGRWDAMERHFTSALEMDRRAGPGVSLFTEKELASALLARGEPGDRVRALELLQHVLDAAQRFKMRQLVDDCIAMKMQAQGILSSAGIYTSIDHVANSVQQERPDVSAHAAPDGTVTIMFSDIEDSTALTERLGDEVWQELLRTHNALIRDRLRAHAGYEVKTLGDGFMVAFQSAKKGLECAVAIQRAFADLDAAHGERVKVRIGLHAGEAIKEGDDFYGRNVIMASRVADKAVGGEILVSSLLRSLVESSVDSALFGEARDLELKGLSGTHAVYSVAWQPRTR